MRIRYAMSEDAIQRYYEIREEYWRTVESSWTDLNELKKRTRALAAHPVIPRMGQCNLVPWLSLA